MNLTLKKELLDLILGKEIIKIDFERGLGIIPSKFVIYLYGKQKYSIEVEANFRIIHSNKIVCCFEDLYMSLDKKVISKKEFITQNNVELTYLSSSLFKANSLCSGNTISKIKITSYGDCYLSLGKHTTVHIINDNQYDDSVIFRVIDMEKKKTVKCKNGKEYLISNCIYEIKQDNKKIEVIKCN